MLTIRSYLAVFGLLIAGHGTDPVLPLPGRTSVEIVARGLDNPRGLAFGSRGELYVAEAGRGGPSGAITMIEFGHQWRVASGLPSAEDGVAGPSDVTIDADGEPVHTSTAEPGLYRGANRLTTSPAPVAAADSVIVDARERALLRIGPRGRLRTVATFPAPGVPSSVTAGPDGAWFVGETFDPSLVRPPAARIWRVEPGRAPRVWATGFTGVVDLAWGPGNRLYVLERGTLTSVDVQGTRRVVTRTGLNSPGGLALRGGHAYVSTCSTCRDTGAVLKIRL
ncbi:hypothetical protein Q0Z83_009190 [Actinoplanes sichuanensis]|uniref:ScyD/ScyE family protein n=1 Tax=Actinoplanes sichuanensis TaxID=512349 RepID=A0ABW4AFL8_9ACTN|nr:ScyD/ScyE family protein [Actinoplanes sichuanensis]BEL02728.1 hypothetical protein Q0Z83_009190 [Actinoplanes sichuanensis]